MIYILALSSLSSDPRYLPNTLHISSVVTTQATDPRALATSLRKLGLVIYTFVGLVIYALGRLCPLIYTTLGLCAQQQPTSKHASSNNNKQSATSQQKPTNSIHT
eukprot:3094754-Amphidinium_carterae.1